MLVSLLVRCPALTFATLSQGKPSAAQHHRSVCRNSSRCHRRLRHKLRHSQTQCALLYYAEQWQAIPLYVFTCCPDVYWRQATPLNYCGQARGRWGVPQRQQAAAPLYAGTTPLGRPSNWTCIQAPHRFWRLPEYHPRYLCLSPWHLTHHKPGQRLDRLLGPPLGAPPPKVVDAAEGAMERV